MKQRLDHHVPGNACWGGGAKARGYRALLPGMRGCSVPQATASPLTNCHVLALQPLVQGWVFLDLSKPSCPGALQGPPRAPWGDGGSTPSSPGMAVAGSTPGPQASCSGPALWHVIRSRTGSKGLYWPGRALGSPVPGSLHPTGDMLVTTWASCLSYGLMW